MAFGSSLFSVSSLETWPFEKGLLILDATHRVTVRPEVAEHIGIAAIKAQASGGRASYRARPVGAALTNIAERTTVDVAVARHRQLQW